MKKTTRQKYQLGKGIIGTKEKKCDAEYTFLALLQNPNLRIERVIDSSLTGILVIIKVNNDYLADEWLKLGIIHPTAKDESGEFRRAIKFRRFILKFCFLVDSLRFPFMGIGGVNGVKAAENKGVFVDEIKAHQKVYVESFTRNLSVTPAIFFGAIMNKYNSIKFLTHLSSKLQLNGRQSDVLRRYAEFVNPERRVYNRRTNLYSTEADGLLGDRWELGLVAMEFAEDYITMRDYLEKRNQVRASTDITTLILKKFYFLYKLGYVHCDDHIDNIMINPKTNDIYIIDFGRTRKHNLRNFDKYIEYDRRYHICSSNDGIKSRFRRYTSRITREMIDSCRNDKTITKVDGSLIDKDPSIERLNICNYVGYFDYESRLELEKRRSQERLRSQAGGVQSHLGRTRIKKKSKQKGKTRKTKQKRKSRKMKKTRKTRIR
jgi:hypothetical protein